MKKLSGQMSRENVFMLNGPRLKVSFLTPKPLTFVTVVKLAVISQLSIIDIKYDEPDLNESQKARPKSPTASKFIPLDRPMSKH